MNRRTKICVWVILVGLANFLLYIVGYAWLYGEAIHGKIAIEGGQTHYLVQSGRSLREVSHAAFVYSGVHSISLWPTVAAVMLSMLTLAKDRIAASMRSTLMRERLLITVCALVIALISGILTYDFVHTFVHHFEQSAKQAPLPSACRPAPAGASAAQAACAAREAPAG